MNRKLLAIPAVLIALAAAYGLFGREGAARDAELTLHGNVDIRQVSLAFNASGRVAELLVQEGDRVDAGQPLARLETTRTRLALQQAQAIAEAQRSQLEKLEAGSRPDEIRQAAALRDAAQAQARDAAQLHARQLDLVARHFVSQQQADSAANALDAAQQRLNAAEAAYRLARQGARREDRDSAAAALAAQQAAVASLKQELAEAELRAPSAGVIESRLLEPGDMASPQKAVLTLALTDPVRARVYLPEAALGRIPAGARAVITSDSHPGREYPGWVGHVAASAEFTPKSVETAELRTSLVYQARVFVCDARGELRQGMPVTVRIAYDQKPQEPPCPAS